MKVWAHTHITGIPATFHPNNRTTLNATFYYLHWSQRVSSIQKNKAPFFKAAFQKQILLAGIDFFSKSSVKNAPDFSIVRKWQVNKGLLGQPLLLCKIRFQTLHWEFVHKKCFAWSVDPCTCGLWKQSFAIHWPAHSDPGPVPNISRKGREKFLTWEWDVDPASRSHNTCEIPTATGKQKC